VRIPEDDLPIVIIWLCGAAIIITLSVCSCLVEIFK
jgi:hypothetical protein